MCTVKTRRRRRKKKEEDEQEKRRKAILVSLRGRVQRRRAALQNF
jgi:hypothetical protein